MHYGPDRYRAWEQPEPRRIRLRPFLTGFAVAVLLGGLGVGAVGAVSYLSSRPDTVEAKAPAEPAKPAPPPAPPELQEKLAKLAEDYGEPVGIAVSEVSTGWVAAVEGDKPFPQQSVSKLWVAMTVLDAVDQGRLDLEAPVVVQEADRSVFGGKLAALIDEDGYETTVSGLIRRAIVDSDNLANDKLISLVGVERVNAVLQDKRLEGIRLGADERTLQSHIAGLTWRPEFGKGNEFKAARAQLPLPLRELAMSNYLADPLDGATPVGITQALSALHRGELLSGPSTEFLVGTMTEVRTGAQRLKGAAPPGWTVAHKTGTGQDLKNFTVGYNDVGILVAPDGKAYSVAVLIQKTSKPFSARYELMQSVTRAVVEQWERERAPVETAGSGARSG